MKFPKINIKNIISKINSPRTLEKKYQKKHSVSKKRAKKRFTIHLEKAGILLDYDLLKKNLFLFVVIVSFLISVYLIFFFAINPSYTLKYILLSIVTIWTLGFAGLIILSWLVLYFYVDLQIYRRKTGIEDVFPDFLQLTSANIRAGMPIDQALWHAIRPNFGVLAREMEDVAKKTMAGMPLEDALTEFANNYDSTLLKRSISLLIVGLEAGGEIGELLDRISTNIQEAKLMQKEMSASVTTYAIFITFAAVVAAPFLLALSNQLLIIIQNIIGSIQIPDSSSVSVPLNFNAVGVTQSDFRIFAFTTLIMTSLISASIVAIIKKGNVKEGLKYIPAFVVSTIIIFFILDLLFGQMMGGIF